jgi:hypothetical protein
MPNKPKRRTGRRSHHNAKLSSEAREQKARADLADGHFRDAITGFKELLKLEQRPDWQSALADAYAGRARELTAKGMVKEALVMWDNRARLGASSALHPEHAALLMRTGGVDRVLAQFSDDCALPPEAREPLRPLLAAQLIAGDERIAGLLPTDDPVRRHADAARDSLAAYCAGDDEALKSALAALPFRSPYRDWVQLLKALQLAADRPAEASAQLARIGDESAFAPLRRAAQLALLPEDAFLEAITDAGEATRRFACALRGWSPARIALHQELTHLGAETKPRTMLHVLYRHRAELGEDWVRQQVLRLMAVDFPDRLEWLPNEGAPPLSEAEFHQVGAWSAELDDDAWEPCHYWSRLAQTLIGAAPRDDDPLYRLRVATALRACERHRNLLQELEPSDDPDDLAFQVAAQLEESLEWDPDDRETYLRLIDHYRAGKRLKDVRRLLARATERWPRDMSILTASFNTALDASAFKKAAGIARTILDIDPINTGVRERLVDALLAHARKQLVKGRPDLARKEVADAADWARSGDARERTELTRGLIELRDGSAAGATLLGAAIASIGGGLDGRVALALAAEGLGMSQQSLQKRAKLPKPAVKGRDDLVAVLNRLRGHLDRGGQLSRNLTDWLDKTLVTMPWKDLDRKQLESACDTLRRCDLHKSRLRAARAALKQWQGMPVFELHAFEAEYPNGYTGYSEQPLVRLRNAMDRARAEGDNRTALRLENALRAANPFGGASPFGFPPPSMFLDDMFDDDDDDDDDDDFFDGLFPDITPDFLPEPFPSQGGPAGGELQQVVQLIRIVGLDKAFEILGLPPHLRREMKALEREVGEEAITDVLLQFLSNGPMFGDDDAGPRPRKPRRR